MATRVVPTEGFDERHELQVIFTMKCRDWDTVAERLAVHDDPACRSLVEVILRGLTEAGYFTLRAVPEE